MSDNLGRALRPVVLEIPLKAGVKGSVTRDGNLIKVNVASTFDFDVTLTVDNYGTLKDLIEVLIDAEQEELQRIKMESRAARGERTRKQSARRKRTRSST